MSSATAMDHACVLVVDDEEDIRETLREAIEMIGCTAIMAANGADALRMLETRRPCLIILDLLMPVMTGQEMLEAMRNEPKLAALPVLLSTSAPQHAPAGVPILPKPINIHAFWDFLRRNCACLTLSSAQS
jgi:two-component system, chemotaxis family, chemotaxis protein CheY